MSSGKIEIYYDPNDLDKLEAVEVGTRDLGLLYFSIGLFVLGPLITIFANNGVKKFDSK